tara:strand:+ start:1094 stop:1468 length:375 start_codon:yes stop_codon:yes gene_type:complete
MQKIAAADLDHLLIKSAHVIRSQEAKIAELEQQLSDRDRQSHAEKIAGIAVDRGVMSEDNAEDYATELASSDRDLGLVEDFVSRSSGAGVPLGSELEKVAGEHNIDGDTAEGRFNNFLLTSDHA